MYSSQATNPFAGAVPMAADEVETVRRLPGVEDASPMLFVQAAISGQAKPRRWCSSGSRSTASGSPSPAKGEALAGPGEVVASTELGKHPGDTVTLGGQTFTVVGTLDATVLAGIPVVYLPIEDVQALSFGGTPVATIFLTSGTPTELPAAYTQADPDQATTDLMQPLEDAQGAIAFISILLWVVAACVLASVMYLSALERTRDFAVFKATGVSNGALLGGLALQAVMIALAAAPIGLVLGLVLAPLFPLGVVLTRSALIALPVVAVVVGFLASLVGMRRVASIDPAARVRGTVMGGDRCRG